MGRPVFSSPFELWKEEGVLFLVLQPGATMKMQDMKEVIRLIAALDRTGKAPVFLEYPGNFAVRPGARDLLRRVCGAHGHPVAFLPPTQWVANKVSISRRCSALRSRSGCSSCAVGLRMDA